MINGKVFRLGYILNEGIIRVLLETIFKTQ